MEYRQYAPPPPLRRFVECLWTLRARDAAGPPQRVLPDGSVELILHLGGEFRRHEPDGVVHRQPRALVVGDVARWMMLESPADVHLIAVRFRPGMTRGVLGVPAGALAGGCHDLAAIGVRELGGILERVGNANPADRLDLLLGALQAAHLRAAEPAACFAHAFEVIRQRAGRVAIDEVAVAVGCSPRHLERQVRAESGLSPKQFARLCRFQAVVGRLQGDSPPAWARLAVECGYHDQPHLVRDFRSFAGTTPAAYWRELHPLTDLFATPVGNVQDGASHPA